MELLKHRFLPAEIDTRLLSEIFDLKMSPGEFHTYYTTFNAYRQHLGEIDDKFLQAAFVKGVDPYLTGVVVAARPTSLAQAVEVSQETN